MRLLEACEGTAPWRQWGPYLIERQWGTLSVEQRSRSGIGTSETCRRPPPERQPSRVQRTYQRAAGSCFVQDVVHSEHFRVVTPKTAKILLVMAPRFFSGAFSLSIVSFRSAI